MLTLETPVQFVKGIGPAIAKMLAEKEVATVEDLLLHLPFRYEDRLNPRALSELKPGEMASVIGEVRGAALLRTKSMPIFEMTVGQGAAVDEVHVVPREVSRGAVPRRTDGGAVRESGARHARGAASR